MPPLRGYVARNNAGVCVLTLVVATEKTSPCHCSICYAWIFLNCIYMHTHSANARAVKLRRAPCAWKLQFKSPKIKHILYALYFLNKIKTILFYIDVAMIDLLLCGTRIIACSNGFFDSRVLSVIFFQQTKTYVRKKLMLPFFVFIISANFSALEEDQNWLNWTISRTEK